MTFTVLYALRASCMAILTKIKLILHRLIVKTTAVFLELGTARSSRFLCYGVFLSMEVKQFSSTASYTPTYILFLGEASWPSKHTQAVATHARTYMYILTNLAY